MPSANLTQENTFVGPISQVIAPTFACSISGTWTGTLTLQRRLDGVNWRDVHTFTENVEFEWPSRGDHVEWRIGFKLGSTPGGAASVWLDYAFTIDDVGAAYRPALNLGDDLVAYWDVKEDFGTGRLTLDGGTRGSSWIDQIAGINLIATGDARPTYSEAGYCGTRKSLVFDGVGNFMRAATTAGLLTGSAPSQTWVLYETIGTPIGTEYMVSIGGTAVATSRRVGTTSTQRWLVNDGQTSASASGAATGSTEGRHMSMGRWNGTTMDGRTHGVNNPVAVTTAPLNTGTTRITLGASNADTPVNNAAVAVSAVLVTKDISIDARQLLESWGYREINALSVLPADHPYRNGPDDTITFTELGTQEFYISKPSMQPFHIDFRTDFLDQIKTTCGTGRNIYDASGNLVAVPENTAAWIDHDPVSNEPLGLASFASSIIYNSDRTLATPQIFVFTPGSFLPISTLIAWWDNNGSLTIYGLGAGQIRAQFSRPVEVLNKLGSGYPEGTAMTDYGLPPVMTTDTLIDLVDPNTVGWYNGLQSFKMRVPYDLTPTTVTLSKVSGATVLHCEAVRGTPAPPSVVGVTVRPSPKMYSTWAAVGLPKDLASFTFCQLTKTSQCMQGGQWLTVDDNDMNNTLTSAITGAPTSQPANRFATNYLSNPRFDVPKSGFMGITYGTGTADDLQGGIDPEDVVTEKMKWRCFFGTGNWITREVAVCCNGGAVRREVFPPNHFPPHMRMVRWLASNKGGASPDGWMAGMYMEEHSYMPESDAVIQAMCSPTGGTGIFGDFDPN